MANSQFCIQQRQQEQQKTKRLLVLGLTGSALLHGILAWAMPKWSIEPPKIAEPIELTIVEKPQPKIESKPIVKPEPKSIPQPKIESKPIVEPEPKPIPQPEPVKTQTAPPPVKAPEPVKTQTTPPKPVPKKVLTTPTPAPSQPIVSAPIETTPKAPLPNKTVTAPTSTKPSNNQPSAPDSPVATNSAPPRPEPSRSEGISCISNCQPEYPAALAGIEGSAGVKLTIDPDGNVIGAELTSPHSNSQVNREALLAARQMQFSSPGNASALVRVKIEFTVAGSEYDRAAREAQARRERVEKERKEQEAARQQQLEQERQARQEQLERERQARQEQLQQQESIPPPVDTQPAPSAEELDAERLRKFRERMEQYRED